MNKQKLKVLIITISFVVFLFLGFFIYNKFFVSDIKGNIGINNLKSNKTETVDINNLKLNKTETKEQKEIGKYFQMINVSENQDLIKNFGDITSTGNLTTLKSNLSKNDFNKISQSIDNIVSEMPENSKLTEEQKIKKVALKYIQLDSTLNSGNYYYKEKEVQEKVKKITNEIAKINKPYFDNFYGNYYLGYSKEIIRDFTGALIYYKKALSYSSEDNKYTTSTILNQIGHLYDLKGDMNKAYEYYFKAYNLNKQNYWASTNIARYLARIGKYENAKKFFLYSLNTRNNALRSEIYFSLSSIELELNGLKPDIDKSIEYAKLGIKSFPDYPMNYVALARGYYMLNDSKYDKDIEENLAKSIKLNPNGYAAYRYLALHMFDKKNYLLFLRFEEKSIEVINKDPILMEEQRKILIQKLNEEKIILNTIRTIEDKKELLNILNNKIILFTFGKDIIKEQIKRVNNGIINNYGLEYSQLNSIYK